jgi:hypothetical protein
MDEKGKQGSSVVSLNGNEILKNFINNTIKENPNELDYFHILENISSQKVDKEIIHSIFNQSNFYLNERKHKLHGKVERNK